MLVWNITRFYGASFACKNFQIPVYMYSKLLPGKTVDSISASFIQHPFHYILQQCTSMHYAVQCNFRTLYCTFRFFSLPVSFSFLYLFVSLYLCFFSFLSLVSIFVFSLSFRQSLSSFFLSIFEFSLSFRQFLSSFFLSIFQFSLFFRQSLSSFFLHISCITISYII